MDPWMSRRKDHHVFSNIIHKKKIVLSPMETILSIPRELEYLENLLKLAWKKRDDSLKSSKLIKLKKMPTIHKIYFLTRVIETKHYIC